MRGLCVLRAFVRNEFASHKDTKDTKKKYNFIPFVVQHCGHPLKLPRWHVAAQIYEQNNPRQTKADADVLRNGQASAEK